MKMKTAGFTLSTLFFGAVMGVTAIEQQKKEFRVRQQNFMDCFVTAQKTHYPSRATPAERAHGQKEAEDITRTAHGLAGIKLTTEQTQQAMSTHLKDSQVILNHCTSKTGVQIEGRWSSDSRPPALAK